MYPSGQAYLGKHPCEKPLAMMEYIIRTSSRPGDVVADFLWGLALPAKRRSRWGGGLSGWSVRGRGTCRRVAN
nr:DNA methyltransferase [Aeromonas allosaccharophila]